MFDTFGSALETEIAYRRERLYDAAAAGSWKRPRGRWVRRPATASRPQRDGRQG
ncbi:MAG: hypothetical protein H0V10_07390 [Geodermatophilaceae bacterium]|nr:hypothetical protein [Geodermatophilaceae bacterium]